MISLSTVLSIERMTDSLIMSKTRADRINVQVVAWGLRKNYGSCRAWSMEV